MSLQLLERQNLVWRGRNDHASQKSKLPLGSHTIDEALNGGLPSAGVVSISSRLKGAGEITTFINVLKVQQTSGKLLIFINAPAVINGAWLQQNGLSTASTYQVFPHTPEDALWACEQCLRSQACTTVLLWATRITHKQSRRLQVAAVHSDTLLLLYRPQARQHQSLPVSVDMSYDFQASRHHININKQLGGWAKSAIPVNIGHVPSNQAIIAMMQQGRLSTQSTVSAVQ